MLEALDNLFLFLLNEDEVLPDNLFLRLNRSMLALLFEKPCSRLSNAALKYTSTFF